jgi:hypothetical protein
MMTSVNVSMPEAMKEFIEVAGAEGQYSTRSEFVRARPRVPAPPRRDGRTGSRTRCSRGSSSGMLPCRDAPVLEVLEPNLRRRIDQKLLAASKGAKRFPAST